MWMEGMLYEWDIRLGLKQHEYLATDSRELVSLPLLATLLLLTVTHFFIVPYYYPCTKINDKLHIKTVSLNAVDKLDVSTPRNNA
jgi:hypothetical protein